MGRIEVQCSYSEVFFIILCGSACLPFWCYLIDKNVRKLRSSHTKANKQNNYRSSPISAFQSKGRSNRITK